MNKPNKERKDSEHRYALWLSPPPSYYATLSDRIAELSRQYDTPCFAPHVTVLGFDAVANMVERARDVATACAPFSLRLAAVACGEIYFRRVFARVAHSAALSALFTASRARFADALSEYAPTLQSYEPHLSLAYGDLSASQCENLAMRARELGLPTAQWRVETLDVVRISGEPAQWRVVERCAFAEA